jgi:hypothetical protein
MVTRERDEEVNPGGVWVLPSRGDFIPRRRGGREQELREGEATGLMAVRNLSIEEEVENIEANAGASPLQKEVR